MALLDGSRDTRLPEITSVEMNTIVGGVAPCIFTNSPADIPAVRGRIQTLGDRLTFGYDLTGKLDRLDGTFSFNGKTYTCGDKIGERSAFGNLFNITDTAGNEYILKMQGNNDDMLREIIVQHILFESTKFKNHVDCPYVPQIFAVFIANVLERGNSVSNLCFIQQKLTNTLKYYIANNYPGDIRGIEPRKEAFIRIARKLNNLWEMYKFNHCDFHSGNQMYIEQDGRVSWRLIDFGQSLLEFNGRPLQVQFKTIATVMKEGRDFSHLFAFLTEYSMSLTDSDEIKLQIMGPILTVLNVFLKTLYSSIPEREQDGYKFMGARYYFNEKDHPPAHPREILRVNNTAPFITDVGTCNPLLIDLPGEGVAVAGAGVEAVAVAPVAPVAPVVGGAGPARVPKVAIQIRGPIDINISNLSMLGMIGGVVLMNALPRQHQRGGKTRKNKKRRNSSKKLKRKYRK